jgi:hypothetical protein
MLHQPSPCGTDFDALRPLSTAHGVVWSGFETSTIEQAFRVVRTISLTSPNSESAPRAQCERSQHVHATGTTLVSILLRTIRTMHSQHDQVLPAAQREVCYTASRSKCMKGLDARILRPQVNRISADDSRSNEAIRGVMPAPPKPWETVSQTLA